MPFTINKLEIFVVCPPRLEGILAGELAALGIKKYRQEVGGFSLNCDLKMLLRLNLWLRTASRILVRLSRFRALHLDQLERPLGKLPWELFFNPGHIIPLHVTASHSRLHHTAAIAERAAAALAAAGYQPQLAAAEESKEPTAALVYLRLVDDLVEVSINSSGQHLYRRGYKQEVGPAPLRENLAAALLLHQGYKGQCALWDPCCGCGTIPIEAALLASHQAPGRQRQFAFNTWPALPAGLWDNELARADSLLKKPTFPIFASDISEKAIQMTQNNAQRAGVAAFINYQAAAVEDFTVPPISRGGLIITNPPYGDRLQGVKGLRNIYYAFAKILNENQNLHGSLLIDDENLARLASKKAISSGLSFNHGGLAVTLYNM